jgi:hypothetical protein
VAGISGVKWLTECSAAALREALQAVAPDLSEYPLTVPGPTGKEDPVWQSGATVVDERFVVKFAWSRPAAFRLVREIGILTTLAAEPAVPFLPEVVASGLDPLLLVTRRVPGASLFGIDLRTFPGPGMGPGVRLLTATMRHYDKLSGRQLSLERVMAWHVRTALHDVLWRTEVGIPLADHRTPSGWIDDLAARFRAVGIDPGARRPGLG